MNASGIPNRSGDDVIALLSGQWKGESTRNTMYYSYMWPLMLTICLLKGISPFSWVYTAYDYRCGLYIVCHVVVNKYSST